LPPRTRATRTTIAPRLSASRGDRQTRASAAVSFCMRVFAHFSRFVCLRVCVRRNLLHGTGQVSCHYYFHNI
jgi:hypothetical protein